MRTDPIENRYSISTIVRIVVGTFRRVASLSCHRAPGGALLDQLEPRTRMSTRLVKLAVAHGMTLAVTLAPVLTLALFFATGRRWMA